MAASPSLLRFSKFALSLAKEASKTAVVMATAAALIAEQIPNAPAYTPMNSSGMPSPVHINSNVFIYLIPWNPFYEMEVV